MAKEKDPNSKPKTRTSATTPESSEHRAAALAMKLALKKLEDGTASNQLIIEMIRLGSTESALKKERMEQEIELITAKTDSIKSEKRSEELFADAIAAMKKYRGDKEDD